MLTSFAVAAVAFSFAGLDAPCKPLDFAGLDAPKAVVRRVVYRPEVNPAAARQIAAWNPPRTAYAAPAYCPSGSCQAATYTYSRPVRVFGTFGRRFYR
jgi:hypothetical protein